MGKDTRQSIAPPPGFELEEDTLTVAPPPGFELETDQPRPRAVRVPGLGNTPEFNKGIDISTPEGAQAAQAGGLKRLPNGMYLPPELVGWLQQNREPSPDYATQLRQAGTTEQPELAGVTPGEAAIAGFSPVLQTAKNVVLPIVAGAQKGAGGFASLQPGQVSSFEDILRGGADLVSGAISAGINVLPPMMGVNAAMTVAPAVEDLASTTVGELTKRLAPIVDKDLNAKIAQHIGQRYGREATGTALEYGVAAKFGLPVLVGMVLSKGAGSVTENVLADKTIPQEDKVRILDLVKNIAFFGGILGTGRVRRAAGQFRGPIDVNRPITEPVGVSAGPVPSEISNMWDVRERKEPLPGTPPIPILTPGPAPVDPRLIQPKAPPDFTVDALGRASTGPLPAEARPELRVTPREDILEDFQSIMTQHERPMAVEPKAPAGLPSGNIEEFLRQRRAQESLQARREQFNREKMIRQAPKATVRPVENVPEEPSDVGQIREDLQAAGVPVPDLVRMREPELRARWRKEAGVQPVTAVTPPIAPIEAVAELPEFRNSQEAIDYGRKNPQAGVILQQRADEAQANAQALIKNVPANETHTQKMERLNAAMQQAVRAQLAHEAIEYRLHPKRETPVEKLLREQREQREQPVNVDEIIDDFLGEAKPEEPTATKLARQRGDFEARKKASLTELDRLRSKAMNLEAGAGDPLAEDMLRAYQLYQKHGVAEVDLKNLQESINRFTDRYKQLSDAIEEPAPVRKEIGPGEESGEDYFANEEELAAHWSEKIDWDKAVFKGDRENLTTAELADLAEKYPAIAGQPTAPPAAKEAEGPPPEETPETPLRPEPIAAGKPWAEMSSAERDRWTTQNRINEINEQLADYRLRGGKTAKQKLREELKTLQAKLEAPEPLTPDKIDEAADAAGDTGLSMKQQGEHLVAKMEEAQAAVKSYDKDFEKIDKAEQEEDFRLNRALEEENKLLAEGDWTGSKKLRESYNKLRQKNNVEADKQRDALKTKMAGELKKAGLNIDEHNRLVVDVPGDGSFYTPIRNLQKGIDRIKGKWPTSVGVAKPLGKIGLGSDVSKKAKKEDYWLVPGTKDIYGVGGKIIYRGEAPGKGWTEVDESERPKEQRGTKTLAEEDLNDEGVAATRVGHTLTDVDFGEEAVSSRPIPGGREGVPSKVIFKAGDRFYELNQDLWNAAKKLVGKFDSYKVDSQRKAVKLIRDGKTIGAVALLKASVEEAGARLAGYTAAEGKEMYGERFDRLIRGDYGYPEEEGGRPLRKTGTGGKPILSLASGAAYASVDYLPVDDDTKKKLKLLFGTLTIAGLGVAMSSKVQEALKDIRGAAMAKAMRGEIRPDQVELESKRMTNDFLRSSDADELKPEERRQLIGANMTPAFKAAAAEVTPEVKKTIELAKKATPEMRAKTEDQVSANEMKADEPNTAIDKYLEKVSIGQSPKKPTSLTETLSGIYTEMVHAENPIAKLQGNYGKDLPLGKQPYTLVQRYRGIEGIAKSPIFWKTTRLTETGELEITGKGLSEILQPFKDDINDVRTMLLAERDIELAGRGDIVGTRSSQSKQVLEALKQKYGENFKDLESVVGEVRDWTRRAMLDPLKEIGAISEETYNATIKANQFYTPFFRVMEGVEASGYIRPAQKFQPKKVPLGRIKGSERDIVDPLESLVRRAQDVADFVERERVAKAVVDMRSLSPDMEEMIKPVTPPIVPVAQIEVQAVRDAGLRRQLLSYAEKLGAKVEADIRIGHGGGTLGYFQPKELIKLRHIADEHVLAHEIGHKLDLELGLQQKFLKYADADTRKAINAELRTVADMRQARPAYARKGEEKIAEMIGAYVSSPELLKRHAPTVTRVLEDLIQTTPELKPLSDIRRTLELEVAKKSDTIFRPSKFQPPNTIMTFEDGQRKYWEVPKDLEKAMKGLRPQEMGIISKLLNFPTKILRAGATLTPEFIGRNPVRDQFSAYVFSKHGYIPGVDLVRGLFEYVKRGDLYKEFEASGAAHSMFVSIDRASTQATLEDVLGVPVWKRGLKNIVNPLKALQILSEAMEKGTRLGAYANVRRKGLSATEAMTEAREITLDFSRAGTQGKMINTAIAFWNANVQGMDKLGRAFKERPMQTSLKIATSITLPSIGLWCLNHDDPEYKEIPQWQKDLFWLVKIPGADGKSSTWLRIPKPFELGVLFGSGAEHVLDFIDSKDPKALSSVLGAIWSAATPGLLPTAIVPPLENYFNKDMFRGRAIVPQSKEDLPPEFQYGDFTSESMKSLGKLIGESPAKIEHLITGYGAGLGKLALDLSDQILAGTGITIAPARQTGSLSDVPGLRAFVAREPIGSQTESYQRFYELYKMATGAKRAVTQLQKEGRGAEVKAFVENHPEYFLAPRLQEIATKFRQLHETKTRIGMSNKLTPDEKRDKTRKIDQIITQTAQNLIVSSEATVKWRSRQIK